MRYPRVALADSDNPGLEDTTPLALISPPDIQSSGEPDSVCAKIAHTAADGKTYSTQYHNLDATTNHLPDIFASGELRESSACSISEHTELEIQRIEGKAA